MLADSRSLHRAWACLSATTNASTERRRAPLGTHSHKKIASGHQLATQPMINMPSATISEAAPAKKEKREFSQEYTTKKEGQTCSHSQGDTTVMKQQA